MAVAEYAKSRGKSSSSAVSSNSSASAAVSTGTRLLRLSSLTVALAATGLTLSTQAFAVAGVDGGTSDAASSTAISPSGGLIGDCTLGEAAVNGIDSINSTAIGCGSTITDAPDSVAIGRENTVIATNNTQQGFANRRDSTAVLLYPTGESRYAGSAVALGDSNSVGAGGGVALGNSNQVTGAFHGIALGQGNLTSGGFAVGLGVGNLSSGVSAVAVGSANEATGNTAIALGRQTYSRADFGIAAGNIATVEAGATNGIALGTSSNVAAAGVNSVAIGANAAANAENSVALGQSSVAVAQSGSSYLTDIAQNNQGTLSVGRTATGDGTDINTPDSTANRSAITRRITNLADGSAASDAVTVAQLTQRSTLTDKQGTDTAAALGGTSAYDPTTGAVSAPVYSVNGANVNNVGAAITNLDGRTTTNTTNIAGNTNSISSLQGQTFRLRANADTATPVAAGDTVTFLDGNNVNINRTGNNVTIGTSLTPTFTTVTSTGAMNAGSLTVTGASNLNGGADLNGNKITSVANGTNTTDAVNFGQLQSISTSAGAKTDALGTSTATNLGGGGVIRHYYWCSQFARL